MNRKIKAKMNKTRKSSFGILVAATMSSGKSTLINALIGHELLPSANESTTSSVIQIHHRNQSNFSGRSYIETTSADQNSKPKIKPKNYIRPITNQEIQQWNQDPDISNIILRGPLYPFSKIEKNIHIIDTPGPNNSQDEQHASMAKNSLEKASYHLLLYVLNATQLGINDDYFTLKEIKNILQKRRGKQIVFILNKADKLDEEKSESIAQAVENAHNYLTKLGFENPIIIPTAASIALKVRKLLNGDVLTRSERAALSVGLLTLKNERFLKAAKNLPIPLKTTHQNLSERSHKQSSYSIRTGENISYQELANVLINSGIPLLENLISYYLDNSLI